MKVKVKSLSRVWLLATPWTVAYQAPSSMGFSRHEYWSGVPFPSPSDLPNPGIEPRYPALQADALLSEPIYVFIISNKITNVHKSYYRWYGHFKFIKIFLYNKLIFYVDIAVISTLWSNTGKYDCLYFIF